ncbi:MAG: 6-hydroxymethylpterin diphosphokinase MptE-like protein [Promethearchaeota archaeon]
MLLELRKQINYYLEFKDWYIKIIKDFKFDNEKDNEAKDILSGIIKMKSNDWDFLGVLLAFCNLVKKKKNIFIFGSGPSLEDTIKYIIDIKGITLFNRSLNLAADGASRYLKIKQIPIDGIFTDLDGITKNEFNYPSFIIVHAHGDNINNLLSFKEEIIKFNNLIGTTQVKPNDLLLNPGGFTDGDRILFFLRSMLSPTQKLYLIGMDFENIVGKYSKPHFQGSMVGSSIKIKKLKYAFDLLKWISKKIECEIILINSKTKSNFFRNIPLERIQDYDFT